MTQKCQGDERCAEEQDILFAIDGSASLSESGFEALRLFASGLIVKFEGKAAEDGYGDYGYDDYGSEGYGTDAEEETPVPTNVGILQFGNGDLLADGTISEALKVQDLSKDLMWSAEQVKSLRSLGGLPNMAQMLVLAESMFKKSERPNSQKTLVLFTNSKPLYKNKAFEQAARLQQQGVRIFVVVASDSLQAGPLWEKADDFATVEKIASKPAKANYFHIAALTGPHADPLSHLPTVFAHTCHKAGIPEEGEPEEDGFSEEDGY